MKKWEILRLEYADYVRGEPSPFVGTTEDGIPKGFYGKDATDNLSKLGKNGWELSAVIPSSNPLRGFSEILWFKRQIS